MHLKCLITRKQMESRLRGRSGATATAKATTAAEKKLAFQQFTWVPQYFSIVG